MFYHLYVILYLRARKTNEVVPLIRILEGLEGTSQLTVVKNFHKSYQQAETLCKVSSCRLFRAFAYENDPYN